MAFIDANYIRREQENAVRPSAAICLFCASPNQVTREHILPRWVFQKDTAAFFKVTVNGLHQTYNKATIPACTRCNSELLNQLERSVCSLLEKRDVRDEPFDKAETEELIRWLELLDYKFHLYNITRQFRNSKTAGDIPYLRDLPLYSVLPNKNYSPAQILTALRGSLRRLAVDRKASHLNSLVVFRSTNKEFHFFHHIDEFMYLEMPQYQIALFYFYNNEFPTVKHAFDQAFEIIKSVY